MAPSLEAMRSTSDSASTLRRRTLDLRVINADKALLSNDVGDFLTHSSRVLEDSALPGVARAGDQPSSTGQHKAGLRSCKAVLNKPRISARNKPNPLTDPEYHPSATSPPSSTPPRAFNRAVGTPVHSNPVGNQRHPEQDPFHILPGHLGLSEKAERRLKLRSSLHGLYQQRLELRTLLNAQASHQARERLTPTPETVEEIHAILAADKPVWSLLSHKVKKIDDEIVSTQRELATLL